MTLFELCSAVVVVLLVLLWKFKNDAFHRYICPCVGGASKQAMMSLQQENQRLRQELNQSKMNASGRYSQTHYGQSPAPPTISSHHRVSYVELLSCVLVHMQVETRCLGFLMVWEACCPLSNLGEGEGTSALSLAPCPPLPSLLLCLCRSV